MIRAPFDEKINMFFEKFYIMYENFHFYGYGKSSKRSRGIVWPWADAGCMFFRRNSFGLIKILNYLFMNNLNLIFLPFLSGTASVMVTIFEGVNMVEWALEKDGGICWFSVKKQTMDGGGWMKSHHPLKNFQYTLKILFAKRGVSLQSAYYVNY